MQLNRCTAGAPRAPCDTREVTVPGRADAPPHLAERAWSLTARVSCASHRGAIESLGSSSPGGSVTESRDRLIGLGGLQNRLFRRWYCNHEGAAALQGDRQRDWFDLDVVALQPKSYLRAGAQVDRFANRLWYVNSAATVDG